MTFGARSRVCGISLLLLAATAAAAQQPVHNFGAEDWLKIVNFAEGSEPVISPGGDWAAYAVLDVAQEANIQPFHPLAKLYAISLTGGEARLLTNEYADSPVWSPSGSRLAFLATTGDHRQLMIWKPGPAPPRVLGPPFVLDRGIWPSRHLGPQWTAGDALVILPVLQSAPPAMDPEVEVVSSNDKAVPGDAPFVDQRLFQLTALDVQTGQARNLIPAPVALRNFVVSPDGRWASFRAVAPDTLGVFRGEKLEYWVVPVDGSAPPRQVLAQQKPDWAIFSHDSHSLIFAEHEALRSLDLRSGAIETVAANLPAHTEGAVAGSSGLVALLAARPGTGPRNPKMYSVLRPTFDLLIVDPARKTITQLRPGAAAAGTNPEAEPKETEPGPELSDLAWTGDGSALFYRSVDQTTYRETIYRWRTGAATGEAIFSADQAIGAPSASADARRIVFTASSAVSPADGYMLDVGERNPRRLTRLNPQLAAFHFAEPKVIHYFSADGDPLDAMLFEPAGIAPQTPVPVVTYVYEKLTPSRNRFDPEAQWYVGSGYGFLMPDVLVKDGYTAESFVKCVIPAVNTVRALGRADRFGITGGSFGGYAGLVLISHSDVFSAAVLRAPPSDFFSTWGDGRDRDIWTIETGQARAGGSPWEDPPRYLDNSPFFQADRVHTPVLIVHGKADYTVPFQQGLMMFSALRALHRTAELVAYRDADHSIVRGSRDRFRDYRRRTLDWWNQYLRKPANTAR